MVTSWYGDVIVSPNKLLVKQSSCRWLQTPRHSPYVTVISLSLEGLHYTWRNITPTKLISTIMITKPLADKTSIFLIRCLKFRMNTSHALLRRKEMLTCTRTDTLLIHWGRVTHICVGNLIIIGSDNGLSLCRCQAIIWTNAGMLLIRTLGTHFSEMFIKMHTFSCKKMHLKMSSGKCRPFSLGLIVSTNRSIFITQCERSYIT